MHTSPIAEALSSVAVAQPVTFRNITMFPLVAREEQSPPRNAYQLLDDGLASGLVEVTEVSEQGRVPELRVVNRSHLPTLIVDGEELVGAKQNRVVNLTILVEAHSKLTIPVSCVEAGRWRASSRTVASAPRTQYASGRAKRMAQVTRSMATAGRYYSDQSQVWADIADKSFRLESPSPTGAMEALFVTHAPFIDECVASLGPVDCQVGVVFTIGERVAGLDLFDSTVTLERLLPKLTRAVAVDALDPQAAAATSETTSIDSFLGAVTEAAVLESPALGVGTDLRLTGAGLAGAALVEGGRVVHLSAFSVS
jgi:hypothetical protein